jgi:hypothetical protein
MRRKFSRLEALEACVAREDMRWTFAAYSGCLDRALAAHGMDDETRREVVEQWVQHYTAQLERWPALLSQKEAGREGDAIMEQMRRLAQTRWQGPEPIEVMWTEFVRNLEIWGKENGA